MRYYMTLLVFGQLIVEDPFCFEMRSCCVALVGFS